jgi:hypothetical protein
MGFFRWLFGRTEMQAPERSRSSQATEPASVLDEAETLVLELWNKQRSLVRQAIFWDVEGKASMVAFPDQAPRDVTLRQLRDAARDRASVRVFFFSESNATAPDGRAIDVIVVEVGDAPLEFYGQRIYSAEEQPKRLAENTASLGASPLVGVL